MPGRLLTARFGSRAHPEPANRHFDALPGIRRHDPAAWLRY